MNTRFTRGRAGVWAGVVGALALAGCGNPPPPVAQAPPDTGPVLTTPTTSPATVPTPTPPPVTPPVGSAPVVPGLPAAPGGTPAAGPTTPTFIPPSSPTFTPPESLPGAQVPGTPPVQPPMPPAPQPPAPQPPVPQPPDPTKPGNPPTGTQPEPPQPTTPQKIEYPKQVGGKDLPGWLKELEYTGGGPVQKDDQIREMAVKIIPSFGPDARKPAVRPLITAIGSDPDPGVQIAAITVVSSMGFEMREEVRPVLTVLQQRLGTSTSGNIVRMYCVRSLASFGPDAVGAVSRLRDVSGDPSWETRREVAIALSMIGAAPVDDKGKPKMKDGVPVGPNRVAIDTLMDFQLKDKSVAVRLEAAKSLLSLGPPVPKNPADFAELTKDIQKTIADVVKFEGGKNPRPNGTKPDRGMYVWTLLLQIMYDHTKTTDNLKELARLVSEPDGPKATEVRLFAIQALGMGGQLLKDVDKTTKEKVVKALADALNYDYEPGLQYTTLQSLAMIGKEASDAVPAVEKLATTAKPKPPPPDAPKGTPPDDSLQRMAKQTAEVLKGTRKIEDFGKEDPKASPPK